MQEIKYPYIPEGKEFIFVSKDDEFMAEAVKMREGGGCFVQPTGGVIVRDGKVIGRGNNAGIRLEKCARPDHKIPTGEKYFLCKQHCKQFGHSESNSLHRTLEEWGAPKEMLDELAALIDEAYYQGKEMDVDITNRIKEVFKKAREMGFDFTGSDFYLDGHWWVCKMCWTFLLAAGIKDVYLVENAKDLYDFNAKANV